MMTPAVKAAALEPRPLPMGMSLSMSSSMGGSVSPTAFDTSRAVCQMRLSGPVEIQCTSRPEARITSDSLSRNRHSRYNSSAMPSASKPGPRLALEAGTRTRQPQPASAMHRDLAALAAGCVDRDRQFESAIAVLPRHQRLAARPDGLAEIEKLPFERLERNRHRVRRS